MFARVRIQAPHVFAPELIPRQYFYVLASRLCEYSHYIHTGERAKVRIHTCEGANTVSIITPQKYFPVFT